MEIMLTLNAPGAGGQVDVAVSAPPDAPLPELALALADVAGLRASEPPELFVDGRRAVRDGTVGGAGLKAGAVVSFGPAASPAAAPARNTELRVVGGPDSGMVVPLRDGRTLIGRAADAGVRLGHDGNASRHHALVHLQDGHVSIEDAGSTNGTWIDGRRIAGRTALREGQMVQVGDSLLSVDVPRAPGAAAAAPDSEGTIAFNRPPRYVPPRRVRRIAVPARPDVSERARFPVITTVAPLVLGVALAAILARPEYLLFTLLSPLMVAGNYLSERRRGAQSSRSRQEAYRAAVTQANADLDQALREELQERRAAAPDPAEILATAAGPLGRLWERRPDDLDALALRVGVGDRPPETELAPAAGQAPPPLPSLTAVPVMVSLREAGVLGVAGPKPRIQALARWLVAQAATLHSPRDLSVVVLAERDGEAPWSWVRWLPHARPGEGSDCLVSVGNDRETVRARVSELLALVAARRIQLEERRSLGGTRFADVVVVMDGARVLRSLPGVATLVQDGPAVGVHAICLDEAASLLPPECSTVVEFEAGESRVTVSRSGEEEIAGVVADQVSRAWADQVGRALAAVRDASAVDEAGGLPDAVRLVDLLEIEPPAAGAVLAGWAAGGRTTEAAVGVAADGPLALDLRRDGPHALVAGTTGAGKSELLQTWIASLAVANRPDALSFVLVDYKGGSAFREASSLPHVVGMVTDLDGHQTERALASLTAELKRREILLAGAEASDIDTYWRRSDRAGGALPALPRLVIVVDEFASLVEELPDFVRGLVGIAQRGRSLGVHLVLATQRPGGSVSPEIRANTNLRIALRMTDASESSDVINAGDAARIPQSAPGRAYVRTGHATLVAFQAARVGGRRRGSGAGAAAPIAVAVSWPMLGRPLPQPRAGQPEEREDTDLSAVVGAVREAAERQPGEPPIRPWLPPLPERLQLSALWADAPRVAVAPLALGLQDLPDQQTQASFSLDLERGGHLMIVGSPGSGRSTVLRTLAGAVAERTSAADVHLYVLDCGNRALACIEALPHCGAVVTRSETERTERLLSRLLEEVADRQHLLSSRGFADVAEQRAAVPPAERLPYILVLLDRWEGFMSAFEELDGGRLPGEFIRLLREGASAGVKVVLTGDRSALTGRVASAVEDRIVLRMNDRSDYGLLGLNQRALPDSIPPGRGFLAESGTEVQFALLTEDDSGVAQVAALQAVAASASERERDVAPERGPRPVALLPNRLTAAQLAYLVDGRRPPSPLTAVLGVGGDSLEPVVLDLGLEGPGCLIAGARRSGRSTALVTIARSLLRAGAQVVILAPRPSPLVDLDGDPGVSAVLTGLEVTEADVLERVGMASGPMVMCIDDAELLNETPVASAVQAVLRSARDRSHAVVAAGTPEDLAGFRGFVPELRKSRTGLLLNPAAPSDGEPLGMRVPRTALSPGPPGRALLVAGGTVTTVQLPALD